MGYWSAVLCAVAERAEKGTLTAIAAIDDDLEATQIVDGERRPAQLNVVEEPREDEEAGGVNWRDNKFIS
jgi:hypothetical protein